MEKIIKNIYSINPTEEKSNVEQMRQKENSVIVNTYPNISVIM